MEPATPGISEAYTQPQLATKNNTTTNTDLENKMNIPEWQKPDNIKDAKPCNINLLPEDKERLRVAGHGSIAQGVRVVLAAYKETGK